MANFGQNVRDSRLAASFKGLKGAQETCCMDGHNTRKMPKTYAGKSTAPGGGGRFAMVEAAAARSGATNPAAVAAAAGRKKYGAAKMAKWAAAGRKRA
jgi:hypothetical protein